MYECVACMHKPSSNDLVVTTRHAWSLQRGQDPVELKLQVWVLRIEPRDTLSDTLAIFKLY